MLLVAVGQSKYGHKPSLTQALPELTGSVKPAEKVEVARSYTDAEEAKFIAMAEKGAFIEDIAAALNKTVSSVRGKALSLTRKGQIAKIPAQKQSYAKESVDPVDYS